MLSVACALQEHPQFRERRVLSLIAMSTDLFVGGAEDLISPDWSERGFWRPPVLSLDEIDWLIEGHRIEKFHMVSALEDFRTRLDDKPFTLYALSQLQSEEKNSVSTPEHLVGIVDEQINRLKAGAKLQ